MGKLKYKTEEERIEANKASHKKYRESLKGKNNMAKFVEKGGHKKYQEEKFGSGVYGIFSKGKCLYIGSSKAIYRRLIQHKTWLKNPNTAPNPNLYQRLQQYNCVFMGTIENVTLENLIIKEKEYISRYNPLYNSDFAK
jgi:hypothetical protein